MSEPFRFHGLHGRAHLRLVAAVGILASAAIATGGLASLFSSEPASESASEPGSEPSASKAETGPTLGLVNPTAAATDTALELELRVREAELAAARARTALRKARQLGRDERDLESYEQRLEQLGISPLESLRRGFGASADATDLDHFGEGRADERERRAHLRAIASPSREL